MSQGPFLAYKEDLAGSGVHDGVFVRTSRFHESSSGGMWSGPDSTEGGATFLLTASSQSLVVYSLDSGKLSVKRRFDLFGAPRALKVVSLLNPDKKQVEDHVVASFDRAKLVILALDARTGDLEPLRFVNAEDDAIGLGATVRVSALHKAGHEVELELDTVAKLACAYVYENSFLFVPLRLEDGPSTTSTLAASKPFVVPLLKLGIRGRVLSYFFMAGHQQPALAILYETDGTVPIGHVAKVQHKCSVVVMGVDVVRHQLKKLWERHGLPHDSTTLFAIQHPALQGALGVVSMNAIILLSRDFITAISLNAFSTITVDDDSITMRESGLEDAVEADASTWLQVGPSSFLASLKNGVLLEMRLRFEGGNHWSHLMVNFLPVAASVHVSSMVTNASKTMLLLCSSVSDTLLLQMSVPLPLAEEAIENTSKKQKQAKDAGMTVEEEHSILYTESKSNTDALDVDPEVDMELRVLDSIASIGPIVDGTFVSWTEAMSTNLTPSIKWPSKDEAISQIPKLTQSAAAFIHESESKTALQLCGGLHKDSSIVRMYRGMRLAKVASRPFQGATKVFALSCGTGDDSGALIILTYIKKIRVLSMNFADKGLDFEELKPEDMGFESVFTDGVTDLGGGVAVQVCPDKLRLVKFSGTSGKCIKETDVQDIGGIEGESFGAVDFLEPYLVTTSSENNAYLFEYKSQKAVLTLVKKLSGEAPTENNSRHHAQVIEGQLCSVSLFHGAVGISPAASGMFTGLKQGPESSSGDSGLEREEKYLYGEVVGIGADDCVNATMAITEPEKSASETKAAPKSKKRKTKKQLQEEKEAEEAATEASANPNPSAAAASVRLPDPLPALEDDMHVVLGYRDGRMAVLSINDDNSVFACSLGEPKTRLPCAAQLTHLEKPSVDPDFLTTFADLRIERISGEDGSKWLCIVGVTDMGEAIVYIVHETDSVRSLVLERLPVSFVTRRKRQHRGKARRSSLGGEAGASAAAAALSSSGLGWGGLIERINMQGRSGLMVGSGTPMMLMCQQGSAVTLSLGFPEIPYANPGRYHTARVHCAGTGYFLSLWSEGESALPAASLGIYREASGLHITDRGNVTFHRTRMGKTCHSCKAILPKLTNDNTEMAMLKRDATFLAVCSQEKGEQFQQEVLSLGEQEEELKNYERFFDITQSFHEPSTDYGPIPLVSDLEYDLSIIQAGTAVDTFKLDRGEHVMETTTLSMLANQPGELEKRRAFIAVATNISDKHGDDTQGEGRLLLFAIDYSQFQSVARGGDATQSEAKTDDTTGDEQMDVDGAAAMSDDALGTEGRAAFLESIRPKLRLLWEGPGPASIVRQFGEYVLSTVGATLYVYKFVPESMELEQISFFIAQFYIQSVSIIKDYILLGDARESVQFVIWREADNALMLLGRDYDHSCALSTGYVVDDSSLGMVVADREANVRVLQYNPANAAESKQGYRLLNLAEFHLGCKAHTLLSSQMLSYPEAPQSSGNRRMSRGGGGRDLAPLSRLAKTNSKRFGLVVGGHDGTVGTFQPVDERVYRRLALLQQIMGWIVPAHFGLNSREFRRLKTFVPKPFNKSGVLDGKLLSKFVLLEPLVQADVVAAMGTTMDTVMDNLVDLDMMSTVF